MQISEVPQIKVEGVSFAPMLASLRRAGEMPGRSPIVNETLKDISFEALKGDRLVIVGPSGAGKTSLLRLLNRLSDPTQGTIYLEGQPIAHIPITELRQKIVLVLQESKLLGMTVQQTLEYPLVLQRWAKPQIQERVGEWLGRLHIPSDWLERNELQLSVGQRQWVAIARALIMQPQVLLLDEPTSALDAGRAEFLINTLADIAQTRGTTILMVNHQLDLAEKFCDRAIYLDQGRLMLDRPKEQLNWQELRQTLTDSEAQQIEEWG